VAKGPRLPWLGTQPEPSGGIEIHEVVVDGLTEQETEQSDDVAHRAVGQMSGQVAGEGFDVLPADRVDSLIAEGGQDMAAQHAAVTGHCRVGSEMR
jgi:hypothetical protein